MDIAVYIPEHLIFQILLRLPAKSVARFRCVSTTWLIISTDPSFILAHARGAPKSFLVRSIPLLNRADNQFHNVLFSFSASGIREQRLDQILDVPRSCCNGLVFFWRKQEPPIEYYVLNLLTGMRIDLPNPKAGKGNNCMELYYHRPTGEYRLINICDCIGPSYGLEAQVLSLEAPCSWRQIHVKAPFVFLFYWQSRVQVNDHLYWACQDFSGAHTIFIFDTVKETFCLMGLPSYTRNSPSFAVNSCLKLGLVNIEGILCCWIVYRDKTCIKNVSIDIWVAVDGDQMWKKAYSLCLVDEGRCALRYPYDGYLLIDCCVCITETELLFLFDDMRSGIYLLHWDLKSGKYWTELFHLGPNTLIYPALTYRETLIDVSFGRTGIQT